jgi:hypothetical protein
MHKLMWAPAEASRSKTVGGLVENPKTSVTVIGEEFCGGCTKKTKHDLTIKRCAQTMRYFAMVL